MIVAEHSTESLTSFDSGVGLADGTPSTGPGFLIYPRRVSTTISMLPGQS
jgi:hypothetical protein